MIRAMRNITVEVFNHLEITSEIDVDKMIKYTERILIGEAEKKYIQVLVECKDLEKGISRYQWNLGGTNNVTIEQFWDWVKLNAIDGAGDIFTGPKWCNYFEKELWFQLVNNMWRKHWSTFQDHAKYIHNDTVKNFRFRIPITMIASARCMTWKITYLNLQ